LPAALADELHSSGYYAAIIIFGLASIERDRTEMMRQVFAIRISLGLGGQITTNLVTNAHVGLTTASPTAITPAEIMSMPTKLSNAAYAYKPTSGYLMNAATLEYIYALELAHPAIACFPRNLMTTAARCCLSSRCT